MITPEMVKELRLVLPIPPRELSPNARPHFMAKARKVKALRTTAHYIARDAVAGMVLSWLKAIEKTTFFFARKANRDGDNLLTMMKPVWDGFQDAGMVTNDSGITHEPVAIEIDPENPRVEVWIRRTA